ncbi:neurogenic locus notch homolog protein 2-like isoform X2 [Dreissena polymorpha]|nr:neurogenic locus notch homolog protein 2-like isoform X2 [Dreissena polymorpha]
MLYTSDLTFRNFSIGVGPICLQATDLDGYTSREICINVHVFPPDPCLSSPCIEGTCEPDNDDSGLFKCICPEHYFGRLCSELNQVCTVGICNHGQCIPFGDKYACYCTDDDINENKYMYPNCLNKTNTCRPNTCVSNELCVDGISKFTCMKIPSQTTSSCSSCAVADSCSSPCNNGGICKGGACICRLGFSADNCSHVPPGSALDLQNEVQFVDPTPGPGSRIVCYSQHKEIKSCTVDVYIATKASTMPTTTIHPSQELETSSNVVCSAENDTYFGFTNVYKCFVDVIGKVLDVTGRHLCVKASSSGASETICWDLVFIHDDPNAKDAVVRFVIPTPLPGSSFTCTTSKPCRMLLYTSYNNSCQQVQSTSLGVTVFDTMERAQTCVTEVAFQFEHDGNHDICFLSASIGYQARCFSVTVMHSAVNDVCSDTTCHNDGACITKSPDKYKCICKEGFTGVKCEQGPCLDRDNTCTHNGTCFVNNHAITCVCEEGTSGDMCESVLTSASEIALTGRSPVFTGTSAIKTISCNKNRECGFSALVVGISAGNMRQIVKGRVSSTLSNIEIRIEALPFRPDFHQAVISFIPTEVGVFDMCILTVNASGTNQDELCLEVDVEEGAMSQYGAKDMPHFVSPSLPLDSKIECEFKTVCHVTFTAHPGLQHEFECIKPSLLRSNFVNTHIFSTCSSCIDGSNTNASCTLDVAFRPSVQNKTDSKVCIVLIRKRTGVSGEDRCFTVTVRNTSKTKDMIGCQLLQCANGGFCDGHDPVNPCVFLQTRIWWTNLCYIYPDQSTHK